MKFVGRDYEISELQRIWDKQHSVLSVVHGRRRIGKTRLIREAFPQSEIISFEGLEGGDTATQKKHFLEIISEHFPGAETKLISSGTWKNLLIYLSQKLGVTPTVVFFDEFQWMAACRTELVSNLKYVWDNYFAKNNKIHLILCGSISSFLVKKVIRSKALYGRISLELRLQPLRIHDFIRIYEEKRRPKELAEFYMAVGGVPEYLGRYKPNKSTRLNLESLICSPTGYLVGEFERIFVSHFGSNPHFRNIVRLLAHRRFADRITIQKACNLETGGRTSQYLEDLELAGFIESYTPLTSNIDSNLKRYRIVDPYLLVYFRFIYPHIKKITSARNPFSLNELISDQEFHVWKGIAFEHLCYMHRDVIAKLCGFSAVRYSAGSWFRKEDQTTNTQIDLMFVRADKVITMCEVKFTEQEISKPIISAIDRRVESIKSYKKFNSYSIEKVLITSASPRQHLIDEGYFTKIILLEELAAG